MGYGSSKDKKQRKGATSKAFHEVFHNVPHNVKASGKTGTAKRRMMTAIALSKARRGDV